MVDFHLYQTKKTANVNFIIFFLQQNSINVFSESEANYTKFRLQRFENRNDLLADRCQNQKRHTAIVDYGGTNVVWNEFFHYQQGNVFFCSPPKTGTTTLDNYVVELFDLIGNKSDTKTNWASRAHFGNRLKKTTFSEVNVLATSHISFMTVRNPLERLLSCWYDKFSGLKEDYKNAINVKFVDVFCCNLFY